MHQDDLTPRDGSADKQESRVRTPDHAPLVSFAQIKAENNNLSPKISEYAALSLGGVLYVPHTLN